MNDQHARLKRPFVLASIMLATFLSAIEGTIVATAMPSIVADLEQFSLYSWVFSAYLLTSSVTVLLFGKLADLFGRKPIFIFGIVVLLLGSTLAGSSTTMPFLIFSRLIQGIGAGALVPVATTIVGDIYTKEERGKVQGYLSSVWGISAIAGPLAGSFFVEFADWRYVFWMNIPLGLIAIFGIILFFKEDVVREKTKINYMSFVYLIGFLSSFMYILVEAGSTYAWTSGVILSFIAMTLIFLTLFIYNQKRASDPIIPVQLWDDKLIFIANITSLLTGAIMISISSYLPTFVQGVLGKSALIAGFTLTTMSIGWPLASTISGRVLFKVGYRKISLIGAWSLLIGTSLFIILSFYPSVYIAAFASLFVGIGMGTTSTAFIVSIQTEVAWRVRGIATATNMFMRSIGSAIGVAFLGGLLNSHLQKELAGITIEGKQVTADIMDQLLTDESLAGLSTDMISLLQSVLQTGLSKVYLTVFIIAIISFIFIYFLPKERTRKQ